MTARPPVLMRLAAAALTLAAAQAHAADPIRVGIALDISGPFAAGGAEARDGIELAIKQLGGKLGGQAAEFLQADTGGSPDQAKQVVDRFIQQNHIDFFTGPVPSNVALAVGPALFAAKVPYVSSNPGPSQYAGKQCNAYFFGLQYQNDTWDEAAGKWVVDQGFKKVFLIAPNYPAGRDHLSGFKRLYKSEIAGEVYGKLGQLDYAAELAQIRAAQPEVVYFFLPGAMGINFIKQFVASGLSAKVRLVTSPASSDPDTISAVGEPMLGLFSASQWTTDLPAPANTRFVAEFNKAYKRTPTFYAAQAYEAIMAIDAAVRDVKGKVQDKPPVLAALKAARFDSLRGTFKYGNNQFPIQDYYLRVIGKDAQGRLVNKTVGTTLKAYQDAYHADCAMK